MKTSPGISHLLVIISLLSIYLLWVPPLFAQDSATATLYLPILANNPDCTMSEQETALLTLMSAAPNQGRVNLTCSAILQRTARAQVNDMVDRAYCTATDPDGYGPNHRVRSAGYQLPRHYSTAEDANNVQTVACGYTTAQDLWNALTPNDHLEGKGNFWSKQVDYGIAHYEAPGSQFVHYWVIITAEPGQ